MLALFIAAPLWVVDTLWPSDTLDFDAMALNHRTGMPGIVFIKGTGMLCLAEYTGTGWVLDTVTSSAATPSLTYDTAGIPHVAFATGPGLSIVCHSKRVGGAWQEETLVSSANSRNRSVSVGFADGLYITVYHEGSYWGSHGVGFFWWNGSSWVYELIAHGLLYYNPQDPSKYLITEIYWPSPIAPGLSSDFNLLYYYYYENTGYMGDPAVFTEVKDRYGRVYAHWDDWWPGSGEFHLNMAKGNWSWLKGNTYVNSSWSLQVSGADLEELPTGEIIVAGKYATPRVYYYYNGTWWYDEITGEVPRGRCAVVLTPDGNLFVAYKNSDGLLHVAHKFFTVGSTESQIPKPLPLLGTVFSRGQEVRLDGEHDLVVYDLSGRTLISGRMASFSTAGFSPGVYILEAKGLGRQGFVVR